MKQIDLTPDEHRPVYYKPLAPRRALWGSIIFCVIMTWVGLDVAQRGGWWVYAPIVPAIYLGICLAGFAPGFWFKGGR